MSVEMGQGIGKTWIVHSDALSRLSLSLKQPRATLIREAFRFTLELAFALGTTCRG
jgi:hypothetical protein